jgi:protein phosphatase
VQEQLDAGLLTQDEADSFEHKNVITRAVGAPDSPPDYWVHPVEPGERLLICSDGLHGEVPDAEIYEVLASYPEPASAVERLIDLALEHGGHDNVSAIVVDVDELAPAEDAPAEEPAPE